ncbi:3434_t:CDS:2 [Gigaspora margarita]|uniref:3434_t:CDS:1 n=1 Tax=Gigaspora margarita TaxID=4874 RepID=A0ABN7UZZ7_GIGMA|nr:3434_t:CDS:2 [Gigaspora margarita]
MKITFEPSPITTLSSSLLFSSSPPFLLPSSPSSLPLSSPLFLSPSLSSSPSSLNTNALSFDNVIFEAVAVVDDIGSTVGDIETATAIDNIDDTFDVEVTATIDDVDNIGSFAAVIVSDVIDVFDLVGVAGFDNMNIGAFDNVGVGAFENTTNLMFFARSSYI